MAVFGQRPDDVVIDSRGNALRAQVVTLYSSREDAEGQSSPLGSAITDTRGRWTFTAPEQEVWARMPDGTVWQIEAAIVDDTLDDLSERTGVLEATAADHDSRLDDLEAGGVGGGVTDHGALTGLSDDDHAQYHNDARGDARYYSKAAVDAALAGKAGLTHDHNDRYYTKDESDDALATKADAGHTHAAYLTDAPSDGTQYARQDAGWVAVSAGAGGGDVNVFDVADYGAAVDGSTDDTAAWQDAIDACAAAGGGIVTSSLAGVSVVAGALQDASGANAQLVLPARHYGTAECIGITIRGPFPTAVVPSVVGATPVVTESLVIKSTLASGSGALLGGYGPVGSPSNFTNVALTVEDVAFRTVSNPTISGLDLRRVANVHMDRVLVDTGSFNVGALTEPSTATSYGLRLPARDNGAHVHARQVDVVGFYTGIEFSEHANLDDVNAWGCKVGFNPTVAHHASVLHRVMAAHCQVGMKFTGGTHALDVQQFNIEHAASGWHATTYDVDDASGYGLGSMRWWAVLAGVGAHDSFTVNGAANLDISQVGDPLSGGGSAVFEYRDRLVASAGNDTVTLGAAPVNGSPLVWINGTIKWPTTDYAIAGSVISLNSALSASDVVLVQYRSTASSASASALSTASLTVSDTFNRADSTNNLGSTTTGSRVWTQHSGTWGISSNKAYISAGSGACLATVDVGASGADGIVSGTITGTTLCGFAVRSNSAGTNLYVIEIQPGSAGTPKIYRGTGGSYTAIATGASTTVAAGSVVTVELSGNNITVKDDGVTIVSATDATYATQTRPGMYMVGGGSTARIDDFSYTP